MIKIICVGKIKENYLKELIQDYYQRINKYHRINLIEIKDSEIKAKETDELLKVINPKDYNIALTITGEQYDSLNFSKHLDQLFLSHGTITFIIGSSNGLDENIIKLCNEQISFSHFTFPHGLFRGILLEQIYRAFKIINNENYHK